MALGKPAAGPLVLAWIAATVVLAFAGAIVDGLDQWFVLAPSRVWSGEVWRLVSWVAYASNPIELALTSFVFYWIGGALLGRVWGERQLLRVLFEVVLASGAVIALLALVSIPVWRSGHLGGWCLIDVLMILLGKSFPDERLFENDGLGLPAMTGHQLVWSTLGLNVVFAFAHGWLDMLPELVAGVCAYLYPMRRVVMR